MIRFSYILRLLKRIAYAGLPENADIEILRKVFLINVFSSIGFALLLGFGLDSVIAHRTGVATVTLSCAAIALVNYVLMLRYGKHDLGTHVVSAVMFFLFFYLLASGGVGMTGPLWCYCVAPLILFIYGVSWGALIVAILFIGAVVILYLPNPFLAVHYSEIFKSRFLASFMALTVMSYLYEYSRHRSYGALRKLRDVVEKEARTDELTGLSNRRHMYEYLGQALQRDRRLDLPLSVLLIDIDHFKQINDSFGHQFGDQVLVQVAHTLRGSLRNHDNIARWGGEEFLVLLTESDSDSAKSVAEKLRSTIEHLPIWNDGQVVLITISIGVHTAGKDESLDEILNRADENLYVAKNSGRNMTVVTDSKYERGIQSRPEFSTSN